MAEVLLNVGKCRQQRASSDISINVIAALGMKYISLQMIPSPERKWNANEQNSSFFLTQPMSAPSCNLHSGWLFKCFQTVMFYSIRLCLDSYTSPPLRPIGFFASYTQNLVLALWIRWLSFSSYWRLVEAVLWGDLFEVMPEWSLLVHFLQTLHVSVSLCLK